MGFSLNQMGFFLGTVVLDIHDPKKDHGSEKLQCFLVQKHCIPNDLHFATWRDRMNDTSWLFNHVRIFVNKLISAWLCFLFIFIFL